MDDVLEPDDCSSRAGQGVLLSWYISDIRIA